MILEMIIQIFILLLLFNDNKINVTGKPGKKQKENPVGCIGSVHSSKR